MRVLRVAIVTTLSVAVLVAVTTRHTAAVTRVSSADGQFWDIQDTSPWGQDSGGIATGGRAVAVQRLRLPEAAGPPPDATMLVRNQYLTGFGLSHDPAAAPAGAARFDSITPVLRGDIVVARAIFAPADTDYLRYFDSFTNAGGRGSPGRGRLGRRRRRLRGGRAGRGRDHIDRRSPHRSDRHVRDRDAERAPRRRSDARAVRPRTIGARRSAIAPGLLSDGGRHVRRSVYGSMARVRPGALGYVFTFTLRPGQTTALVTFVVKGLSELYDSRGDGPPVRIRDGVVTPPQAGADTATDSRAGFGDRARDLDRPPSRVRAPDLRGLTPLQRSQIANWTLPATSAPPPFSVVEKTRRAASGRDDARRDDVGGHRPRVPDAADAIRSQRPGAAIDARAQSACARRRARSPTPSAPPAAFAGRFTASRSPSRTTSTCSGCRPPAARWRWSTTSRGSIRAWPRGCAPPARSSSARRTSTSFRSATSASARSPARSGTPTIRRSAPRDRAAAARSRWRPAW